MRGLLGSLCILSGGGVGIWLQARERRRRRELLRDLMAALQRMEETIRLARTPLPQLLEQIAQGLGEDAGSFFWQVAKCVHSGETPDTAWRREAACLPLPERERGVLGELDFQGDEAALCGRIRLVVQQLAGYREEREQEEAQEAKRTAALWASGAALLVILLI